MLKLLIEGCLVGLAIAMPVGPIGLLCIRNSLTRGMTYGLACGLGAACADTIYGALGGFGVTAIGELLESYRLWLECVGALVLLYIGVSIFREEVEESSAISSAGGHLTVFSSTFVLTLANPMTLLSFAGIYAGLGVGSHGDDWLTPLFITVGVFIGSAFWWLLLSMGTGYFHGRIGTKFRQRLNQVSGAVIISFGFVAAAHVLWAISP